MSAVKLIDYAINSANSLADLQTNVCRFQVERAGGDSPVEWYPSGAPLFHTDDSGTWHQAMYGVEQGEQ